MTSSPFRIEDFWSVATPATTLCLLDGTYQGTANMIHPPSGLSGTNGSPITIRALNDGKVLIDGQHSRKPVSLSGNSWFVLEGFNAARGDSRVILIANQSNHNIVRRVVGWDARIAGQSTILGYHKSSGPLLVEDFAAFGVARKGISNSQGGNNMTCRRCWVRWEGSIHGSTFPLAHVYNSFGFRGENLLVTWSGESQPESAICSDSGHLLTDYAVCSARGILGMDRIDNEALRNQANTKIYGSLVYVKPGAKIRHRSDPGIVAPQGLEIKFIGGVELRHIFIYLDPSLVKTQGLKKRGLQLGTDASDPSPLNSVASNISVVAPVSSYFSKAWAPVVAGHAHGTSLSGVPSPWTQSGSMGARLCERWVNGKVTATPLWPWPMNERIKQATAIAGAYTGPCPTCQGGRHKRTATDVTAEIEALLGPIPPRCRL